MYINMIEELQEDLNKKSLRTLYLIFNDSIEVYRDLIEKEREILSGDYFEEIKGRLLGFIIKKAFDPILLPINFPFNVHMINMPFKQKAPKLIIGNTILTISKVVDSNSLPSVSKYKKEYSKGNSLLNNQLEWNLSEKYDTKDLPYYGIIAYEYYHEELKSLNILIPDSNFKNIIKTIPIPLVYAIEEDKTEEKTILNRENLKKSVLSDLKLKQIK